MTSQSDLSDAVALESGSRMTDEAVYAAASALLEEGHALKDQRADYPGAIAKYEAARAEGRKITDARLAQAVEGAALGNLGNA